MAGLADIVTSAPGATFAVDDQLRIVAWNRAAEQGLGLPAARVLGACCYDTVQAVDADTGEPCFAQCPLIHGAAGGWGHSRLLKARWRGGKPIQLDCMLLQCLLPSAERGTVSFLTPLGARDARRHLRALAALEALYPTLTQSTDLTESLRLVVRTVLQATEAEAGALIVLEPATGVPAQVIHEALAPQPPLPPTLWPRPAELVELVARAAGALVVVHHPRDAAGAPAGGHWCLAIPLLAEGRLVGALSLASRRRDFTPGFAARVLFAVGGQLSVVLQWAGAASLATSTPGLRCYCFGAFRVVRDGHEILPGQFKRQKALALLKVLVAHRGRPLHRDALIEVLWPEADPDLAGNNLRVVLHDLRYTLEPGLARGQRSSFVLNRGALVYLEPSARCWTDVDEFERLAAQAERLLDREEIDAALAAGRAAADLYLGEYLADEPYLDWCIAERERLREVYVGLVQRVAAAYAARGQSAEAIRACRLALAADRLREATHRQLIDLLWRAGYRDEALRQYETCRRVLWHELQVMPDEATQALHRTILSAGPPRA